MTLDKTQINEIRALVRDELRMWETGNPTTEEIATVLIRTAVDDPDGFVKSFLRVDRAKVLSRLAILGVLEIAEKAWGAEVAANN